MPFINSQSENRASPQLLVEQPESENVEIVQDDILNIVVVQVDWLSARFERLAIGERQQK